MPPDEPQTTTILITLPLDEAGMLITMAKMEDAPPDWIVMQAIRGMWTCVAPKSEAEE